MRCLEQAVPPLLVAPPVVPVRIGARALLEDDPNVCGIHSDPGQCADDARSGVQAFKDARGDQRVGLIMLVVAAVRPQYFLATFFAIQLRTEEIVALKVGESPITTDEI